MNTSIQPRAFHWVSLVLCPLLVFGSHSALGQGAYEFGNRFTALGFGEIDYRETDGTGLDGFVIGQFVGHLSGQIDDRLSFFTEMTATSTQDDGFNFEIERLFVRYEFSDHYKLSAGRFHTPLGHWNGAFHHGTWLQTTVGRPQTVKFGSNVVPIHFVGATLDGRIGQSDFLYRVGVGNGRSDRINQPGDSGDINDNRAWFVSARYRPISRYLLDTGVSVYVDRVTPTAGPEVDEVLWSAYLALQSETPEVIAEYHFGDHERTDTAGPNGSVDGGYAQFAYRLAGGSSNFKPYIRFEKLDVDDSDPLLGTLGLDYEGVLGGVRWDFSRSGALKFEYRNEEFDNAGTENSFWIQLAFVLDGSQKTAPPGVEKMNKDGYMAARSGYR